MSERKKLVALIHAVTFYDEDGYEYASDALGSDTEGLLADAILSAGFHLSEPTA